MFLAITFMCLANGECSFIQDRELTTQEVCNKRNESLARVLEANPTVTAYRFTCVKIPQYKEV
jgi:hypothetical protein